MPTPTQNLEEHRYFTTREACRRLGYSRPSSFVRAWRAKGLPFYQRPGGHLLVRPADIERFLTRAA